MKISYKWLQEYLPTPISLPALSSILNGIGLEVEGIEHFESIKGSLKGLIIGEVIDVQPHPNADRLKVTQVNIGKNEPLIIVCGASNVAAGQKVVVATVGTTIFSINGEATTMKVAKIRGIESYGMICAEDELGISNNHDGIIVLPTHYLPGTPAAEHFQPYEDEIIVIGLTPNRMDAMSHLGVAKDVCAYLTHHSNTKHEVKYPYHKEFTIDAKSLPIKIEIQNAEGCQRYSGISLSDVNIQPSPHWLANRLLAIGVRSINNVVDISNYILHETGQPLHIFDIDAIKDKTIIVRDAGKDISFMTLDGKERKLNSDDLMICNAQEPMCIAGVFGGQHSGVTEKTKNIFIESAWFSPENIRKTSIHHGLRTDAAIRFEKGVDISQTVEVLKRTALLIKEIAGGKTASDIIDIYPTPKSKKTVTLSYAYLKKIVGKDYDGNTVKNILTALHFDIIQEGNETITVAAPYNKPDIHLPADIVEEIIRIDGLDNIPIPTRIILTPSIDKHKKEHLLKEKLINHLIGKGFKEIITNSITNSKYYTEETLQHSVKLLNNLSVMLDVMRPSMLETGLEVIAYNTHRKNENLLLFEFGKTYNGPSLSPPRGKIKDQLETQKMKTYQEKEHFTIYVTGAVQPFSWKNKAQPVDLFWMKGLANSIIELFDIIDNGQWTMDNGSCFEYIMKKKAMLRLEEVSVDTLNTFDVRQTVWIIDIDWKILLNHALNQHIVYKEVARFPAVERDLALIVNKNIIYSQIEESIHQLKLHTLQSTKVFDVFEHEKIGKDKRSIAIRFIFQDEEKTLTDNEVEKMMNTITQTLEKNVQAEVRK